nr:unnamed protein product [Leishmania braziliensis]
MRNFPWSMRARRYMPNFNAMALVLLAVQNAGYLILMKYAQQADKHHTLAAGGAEPEGGEAQVVIFKASHFLATTEVVKLILSLLWCIVDEVRAMQQESAIAEADTTPAALLRVKEAGWGSAVKNAASPNGVVDEKCRLSPALGDAAEDIDAECVVSVAPLRVLVTRKRFAAVFVSRMRHAIGLDHKYKEALLMVAPAIIYAIQGLLLIYAIELLDTTVFQVLYQVRIMFLAAMMGVVLDFRLSPIRWVALVVLMFGITLAQVSAQSTRTETTIGKADEVVQSEMGKTAAAEKVSSTWSIEGTLAVLAGAFLSALSGVFMEFVVKKRCNQFHLSARNIHLAFFSVVYFLVVFLCEIWRPEVAVGGLAEFISTFFDGFTSLVWTLVALQAVGGILVALVMRYCDNIVKSFSTAFAIVLNGMASVFLFHTALNTTFLVGAFLVLCSIIMYSLKK